MRVLLISPVRGLDPLSGDVTYTEQLLAAPPAGVEYVTYDRALAEGTLAEWGTRSSVASAGHDPLRQLGFAVERKVQRGIRSTGWAYREQVRHFVVRPHAFDLVHVHVFNTCFHGPTPPILMSAAGPLSWVYADAWGWTPAKVKSAELIDAATARISGATICCTHEGQATRHVVFSEYLRQWMLDRGWDGGRIDVVPNYLNLPLGDRRPATRASRLGFVAQDFKAKGGDVLLAAFTALRADRPDLSLHIVGSEPALPPEELQRHQMTWRPFVPREELITDWFPSIDILVHPSLFDGLPYGPMEALAFGIPCIVSNYRALPELVGSQAGLVTEVGDVPSVVRAIGELLEPTAWKAASDGARARYREKFSAESQAPALFKSYCTTLVRVRHTIR